MTPLVLALSSPTAGEPVLAVHLVRDAVSVDDASSGVLASWWIWAVGGAILVGLIIPLARLVRSRLRGDASARALRTLSRHLGLSRADRELLGILAGSLVGADRPGANGAVALILSQDAFIRAASAMSHGDHGAEVQRVAGLHRKIFAPSGVR